MMATGRQTVFAVAGVLALAAAPVGASTHHGFAGLTIFGDSLSDFQNAALAGAAAGEDPDPQFPLGKASDGPLWSEIVLDGFTAAGLPARNLAVARARISAPGDPSAINLPAQIDRFVTPAPPLVAPGELALFWIGANDMRDALGAVLGGFLAPTELVGAAEAAVGSLLLQAQAVTAAGFDSLMFVNLPDLSRIPATLALVAQLESFGQTERAQDAAAAAAAATNLFNTALSREVSNLALAGVTATVFDLNAAFLDILDNPPDAVTQPVARTCLQEIGAEPAIADLGQCTAHFFYDDIHPSSTLHAALAAEIGVVVRPAQVGVIPLPATGWLLLGGLAGLGALARRRRRG